MSGRVFPRRRVLAAVVAILFVLGACTSGGEAGDSVTIYSGRTENLIAPILDRFAEETGIDVRVRYDQSANLALLIEEEAAAGRVQADVFLSQSPGSIGFLDQNDRLSVLPSTVLDLVPTEVRDGDGRWVGFSGRQRVLVYNADRVDESELPSSVFDLTAPEWSGRIGVAPANGSFQDFVTAMRATEGDDTTSELLVDLGYKVLRAPDGPTARALLENGTRIDVMLTDIVMPGGLNGIDLARFARERFPRMAVVLTSGYAHNGITHQGVISDDMEWIGKPYDIGSLARKIRAALDG